MLFTHDVTTTKKGLLPHCLFLLLLLSPMAQADNCQICQSLGNDEAFVITAEGVSSVMSCLNQKTFKSDLKDEERIKILGLDPKADDWKSTTSTATGKKVQAYLALYFGENLAIVASGQNGKKKAHWLCRALFVDMDDALSRIRKFTGG